MQKGCKNRNFWGLLHTVYSYNGKVFGLRAGEHRILRIGNIVAKLNIIIFDESHCKTFQRSGVQKIYVR